MPEPAIESGAHRQTRHGSCPPRLEAMDVQCGGRERGRELPQRAPGEVLFLVMDLQVVSGRLGACISKGSYLETEWSLDSQRGWSRE